MTTIVEFKVTILVEYCESTDLVPPAEAKAVARQALTRALQHFYGEGFPLDNPKKYAIGRILIEEGANKPESIMPEMWGYNVFDGDECVAFEKTPEAAGRRVLEIEKEGRSVAVVTYIGQTATEFCRNAALGIHEQD